MNIKLSIIVLFGTMLFSICSFASNEKKHPRIYTTHDKRADLLSSVENVEWKQEFIENKKANVDKYINLCKKDPNWLLSRLQMNWKTKHNKVFLFGTNFSHSSGEAPVPTVRFSGSRDWATDYKAPSLEEIQPYFDDERGMYFKNKESGKYEWVHPSKTGHIIEGINRRIMRLVQDAAFLYWFTGDKKYAQFAEPVFLKYIEGMYYRDAPIDLENGNQQRISGLATFEVIHEQIVVYLTVTYDFLHSYLIENGRDLSHTINVFQKWGDQIINNGIPDNNWNLFQARFLTYIALALDENSSYENKKGREYFLRHILDKSTERQIAIKESILEYDQETAIWFESPSYSTHVTTTLLRILTLLDNITNKNEIENFPIIKKSVWASLQYLFPTGYTVAFGDAKHKTIPAENLELMITNSRKYGNAKEELQFTELLKQIVEMGEYSRKSKSLFEFFFYVNDLKKVEKLENSYGFQQLLWPTFYAPNVSWFVQRIGNGNDAMMVSTVGSFGNHAHVNGIAIEVFANNYVLGPDMGHGASYWNPKYREYYSQFPAHNTVVVDGKSTYGRMRGYHPFTLDSYYPEIGKNNNKFDDVTFSKVSFVEPETKSDQQRLTAQIKSETGKGYIVDIFRSRKQLQEDQRHEYFYHNLGQSLKLYDESNSEMTFSESNELSSKSGDMKAYDYLTDKYFLVTSKNVSALFSLKSEDQPDNFMKVWINKSNDQKIFSVISPKSAAITEGTAPLEMIGQKIPTLILRREGECWSKPFVIVFNPYLEDGKNPITNVKFSKFNSYPYAQKLIVTHSDEKANDIIVANSSVNDIVTEGEFYQKGLLSITRINGSSNYPKFIFLSDVYEFKGTGWEILSKQEAVTISIKQVENGFQIETDNAVVIRIPISRNTGNLKLYKNGKLYAERSGLISRFNQNHLEYRIEKAYEKAFIELN